MKALKFMLLISALLATACNSCKSDGFLNHSATSTPETELAIPQKIEWLDLSEADAKALSDRSIKENKVILVYLHIEGCQWCAMMNESFKNKDVIRIVNEKFIAVTGDVTNYPSTATSFNIDAFPGIWFGRPKLDDSGKLSGTYVTLTGYRSPEDLVKILELTYNEL